MKRTLWSKHSVVVSRGLDLAASGRSVAIRLVVAAALLAAWGHRVSAQRPPADARLLIEPRGAQATVVATFRRKVDPGAVRRRFAHLASVAGWTIGSLDVREVESLPGGGGGRQTAALAALVSSPQIRDYAFILQPYIEAFGDLGRLDILYIVAADPAFQGLREYQSPALSVTLTQNGGPYRYEVIVRPHSGPLPTVPLTQPAAASRGSTEPARRTPATSLVPVVTLALLCGAAVFIVVLVRTRQRPHPVARPRPERSSRL